MFGAATSFKLFCVPCCHMSETILLPSCQTTQKQLNGTPKLLCVHTVTVDKFQLAPSINIQKPSVSFHSNILFPAVLKAKIHVREI